MQPFGIPVPVGVAAQRIAVEEAPDREAGLEPLERCPVLGGLLKAPEMPERGDQGL